MRENTKATKIRKSISYKVFYTIVEACVRSITLSMNMVGGFYTSQKDLPLAEKIGKFSPLFRYCTIGFERLTGRGLDNHKSTISAWIGVCCYNLNEVTFLLDLSVI